MFFGGCSCQDLDEKTDITPTCVLKLSPVAGNLSLAKKKKKLETRGNCWPDLASNEGSIHL